MIIKTKRSTLKGEILIPASKSHTIRAIAIATMAGGESLLFNPLLSDDTLSCVEAAKNFGAEVIFDSGHYRIKGTGGKIIPRNHLINVGNSGTTLRIFTALASLCDKRISFDGDHSIRTRPMEPLLTALSALGVSTESTEGRCPLTVQGPLKGGKTTIRAVSSQFLTALLITCPLAEKDTEIVVEVLNEKPYIDLTLDWLKKQQIQYEQQGYEWFKIKGKQSYTSFQCPIPSDFSTATFALLAAAITGSEILIKGLDFSDSQGDKAVFDYFRQMGTKIRYSSEGVWVKGNELRGIDIDMNATPDALPAMAVAGCFAKGTTRLLNVPQARLKECDRIAAMEAELKKMGANIEQLPDGMIIHESHLQGMQVHGYADHRIVMALGIAGMASEGETCIDTAEAFSVTYPQFTEHFKALGAKIEIVE